MSNVETLQKLVKTLDLPNYAKNILVESLSTQFPDAANQLITDAKEDKTAAKIGMPADANQFEIWASKQLKKYRSVIVDDDLNKDDKIKLVQAYNDYKEKMAALKLFEEKINNLAKEAKLSPTAFFRSDETNETPLGSTPQEIIINRLRIGTPPTTPEQLAETIMNPAPLEIDIVGQEAQLEKINNHITIFKKNLIINTHLTTPIETEETKEYNSFTFDDFSALNNETVLKNIFNAITTDDKLDEKKLNTLKKQLEIFIQTDKKPEELRVALIAVPEEEIAAIGNALQTTRRKYKLTKLIAQAEHARAQLNRIVKDTHDNLKQPIQRDEYGTPINLDSQLISFESYRQIIQANKNANETFDAINAVLTTIEGNIQKHTLEKKQQYNQHHATLVEKLKETNLLLKKNITDYAKVTRASRKSNKRDKKLIKQLKLTTRTKIIVSNNNLTDINKEIKALARPENEYDPKDKKQKEAVNNEVTEKIKFLRKAEERLAAGPPNEIRAKEIREQLEECVNTLKIALQSPFVSSQLDTYSDAVIDKPLLANNKEECLDPKKIEEIYNTITDNSDTPKSIKNLAASYLNAYDLIQQVQGGAGTKDQHGKPAGELKQLFELVKVSQNKNYNNPESGLLQRNIIMARARLATIAHNPAIAEPMTLTEARKMKIDPHRHNDEFRKYAKHVQSYHYDFNNMPSFKLRKGWEAHEAEKKYLVHMIITSEHLLEAGKRIYQERMQQAEQIHLIRPFGTPRIRIGKITDSSEQKQAEASAWAKELATTANPGENIIASINLGKTKYQETDPNNPLQINEWYKSNDPREKEYDYKTPVTLTHVTRDIGGQRSFQEFILELPLELSDHYQLALLLAKNTGHSFTDESGKITNKENLNAFLTLMKKYELPKNLDNNQEALERFLKNVQDNKDLHFNDLIPYLYSADKRRAQDYMDNLDIARSKKFPEYMAFTKKYMDGIIAERALDKSIPNNSEPLHLFAKNEFINQSMRLYCKQLTGENQKIFKEPQPTGRKIAKSTREKINPFCYIGDKHERIIKNASKIDAGKYQPSVESENTIKKLQK